MWKQLISNYFSFNKKERTGVMVLLFFIAFFMVLPLLYPFFIKHKKYDHSAFENSIEALNIQLPDSGQSENSSNTPSYQKYQSSGRNNTYTAFKGELFYFDPNTAGADDWKKLGVRDKTIKTIQNYISKGGRFYKKEDIGKIWGLHEDEIQRLMPYVQIKTAASTYEPKEKKYEIKEFKKVGQLVDINIADTSGWIALPGIGSKLSQRIINFREKLGGFYSVEQIGETFGLPDSTFQKIKGNLRLSTTELRLININTASMEELKLHPYIRYALANAIVQYRLQHGNYATVKDIKKIMTVTDELYNKIAPYLKTQ